MQTHLVSFFGEVSVNSAFQANSVLKNRQELLHQTALQYGCVDYVHSWNLDMLRTTTYFKENSDLLSQPRGCGYWAWKPYIILETLKKTKPNDYVMYCDIGKPHNAADFDYGNQITCSLRPIIHWAEQNGGLFPGVYLPHHGAASKWIKADCFELMDCRTESFQTIPTIQAGYTAWKNVPAVIRFLEKWQQLNLDPRLVSDDKNTLDVDNSDDFVRHCHDQATLTLLCEKENIQAFGDKQYQFWGFRNINFIAKRASFELKKKSAQLTFPQINQDFALLPKLLNQWIELIYCDLLLDKLVLLIPGATQRELEGWKQYLPNADIDIDFSGVSLDKYDLIITKNLAAENYNERLVIDMFEYLKEESLAIIGPLPKMANGLNQYAQRIAKEERFMPSGNIDKKNISKYPLKIHNSRNPIFVRSTKESFVLMYKPKKMMRKS